MRLFVAFTPPPEIVEQLRQAAAPLRPHAPDLRWTRPDQWHLTLAFLGEVGPTAHRQLVERLARAARRHRPLELSLRDAGRFGHRILWTKVGGERDALRRLAASVSAAARRSGLPTEDRPHRPHLTLARATRPTDLRPLVERLAGFESTPWIADELHLVQSLLGAGPGGSSRYELTASWPLGRT